LDDQVKQAPRKKYFYVLKNIAFYPHLTCMTLDKAKREKTFHKTNE